MVHFYNYCDFLVLLMASDDNVNLYSIHMVNKKDIRQATSISHFNKVVVFIKNMSKNAWHNDYYNILISY